MKPTYKEQRLDPRWQKRRLEIMERDGFRCQDCERRSEFDEWEVEMGWLFNAARDSGGAWGICAEIMQFAQELRKRGDTRPQITIEHAICSIREELIYNPSKPSKS